MVRTPGRASRRSVPARSGPGRCRPGPWSGRAAAAPRRSPRRGRPATRLSPWKSVPAELPESAGSFDLPIARGLLVATGQLLPEQLKAFATVGELALDGSVRPVKGALSMAMAAAKQGARRMLVPAACAREAAVVKDVAVFAVGTL